MNSKKYFYINPKRLSNLKKSIPPQDFANLSFDLSIKTNTKDVLILLTTQRSGSTFFCDLLRKNNLCIAHEYFQHYQYMHYLASNWGCIEVEGINKKIYIQQLKRYRTTKNGWLGIKLHGSHIVNFLKFQEFFTDLKIHYIHLVREDKIAQAVSYEIGSQTGAWNSNFKEQNEPQYNYKNILKKLERIEQQSILIEEFVKERNIKLTKISYEELIEKPQEIISQ